MALSLILVVVLAGGAGGRLELLTDNRAKPAVSYGGMYRLIDFPLSCSGASRSIRRVVLRGRRRRDGSASCGRGRCRRRRCGGGSRG